MLKFINQQYNRICWFIKYKLAKKNAINSSLTVIRSSQAKNVLVMCYGNIYRSPFVEAYLKSRLSDDYNIKSAGFFKKSGRTVAQDYIELTKEFGVDLSTHLSNCVYAAQFNWADHILIMDGKNYKLAMQINSDIKKKLVWLGALDSFTDIEIDDPYAKSENEQLNIVKRLVNSSDSYISLVNASEEAA
ncbi:MAG: low molecular weight phosphatase family protein [Gammaproteobacteria bacterium]|nr:low molecular weight phosphatase family protein [Gammaproteobacteria bacterium]